MEKNGSESGTSSKRVRKESDGGDSEEAKRQKTVSGVNVDQFGIYLPSLVAIKIFRLVVESDGALPSLYHLSQVNSFWYNIAKESSLIQKLRLPVNLKMKNDQVVIQILSSWDLSKVKEIDFSGWTLFTDFGLQALADSCPLITCANLSGTAISNVGIQRLVDQCPALTDVNLSSLQTDALSGSALQDLLNRQGKQLRSLCLARNSFKSFSHVLNLIISACFELRILDLSDIQLSKDRLHLDVAKLQSVCSKLEILHLGNSAFHFCCSISQAASQGFPELRELCLGSSCFQQENTLQVSDNILKLMLKKSHGLRKLDVSGCRNVTVEGLKNLVVTDLESLLIANFPAVNLESIGIILTKWMHSLRHLDFSCNVFAGMMLDMVLKKQFRDAEKSQLSIVSLVATQITTSSLKSLLEELPRLTCLRLAGCRGLPRVMQKEFRGEEVIQLRLDLVADTDGGRHM